MSVYRRIFVVIDPTVESQPALERAVLISTPEVEVHAFLSVYAEPEEVSDALSRKDGKQKTLKRHEEWLAALLAPYRAQGCRIQGEVLWNAHWPEAVCYMAARRGADLIIKSTQRHSRGRRMLFKTSDRYLLRNAPVPVLLVRQGVVPAGPILGAADLYSKDAAHWHLNRQIVRQGLLMAELLEVPFSLVSAAKKRDKLAQEAMCSLDEVESDTPQARIGCRFGLAAEQILLCEGSAARVLVEQVKEQGAAMLVMGTLARTGVKALVMGNTAEKILDRIECDVLAIN